MRFYAYQFCSFIYFCLYFYLVLISSTLHYILPKYMWYHHDVGFKFNFRKFTENVRIEVSYTSSRDLQLSLKIQNNEENTTHVF